MLYYQAKTGKIPGTDLKEVLGEAFDLFLAIKGKSKRKPYVRSIYFGKKKIFLHYFWEHVFQKTNWRDRLRRLKYFPAALELIAKTRISPTTKDNPNQRDEILHRFLGKTKEGDEFMVQIKEFKKTGKKYLISVFPT